MRRACVNSQERAPRNGTCRNNPRFSLCDQQRVNRNGDVMSGRRSPIVRDALSQARKLNEDIRARGLRIGRVEQASRCVQWRQMALASEAVLTALDAYLTQGGGSRGARAVCDPEGSEVPSARFGPLEAFRFRAERKQDRTRKLIVRGDGAGFACEARPIRRRDPSIAAYFERDWGRFLSGAIYEFDAEAALQGIES
jgi:succinate dehydrogenase / fumarate reductase, flavoprotein subunit